MLLSSCLPLEGTHEYLLEIQGKGERWLRDLEIDKKINLVSQQAFSFSNRAWGYLRHGIKTTKHVFKHISYFSVSSAKVLVPASAALSLTSIVGIFFSACSGVKGVKGVFAGVVLRDSETLCFGAMNVVKATGDIFKSTLSVLGAFGTLLAEPALQGFGLIVGWIGVVTSVIGLTMHSVAATKRALFLRKNFKHFKNEEEMQDSTQLRSYLLEVIGITQKDKEEIAKSVIKKEGLSFLEMKQAFDKKVKVLCLKKEKHFSSRTSKTMLKQAKELAALLEIDILNTQHKQSASNLIKNMRSMAWRRLGMDGSLIAANIIGVVGFISCATIPMAPYIALAVGSAAALTKVITKMAVMLIEDLWLEKGLRPVNFSKTQENEACLSTE